MSAASPATSPARRTEAAAPSRSVQHAQQPVRQPVGASAAFAFAAPSANDEIRLNLGDIPLMSLKETMEVEGFRPSLLSRLLDLVAPLDKR